MGGEGRGARPCGLHSGPIPSSHVGAVHERRHGQAERHAKLVAGRTTATALGLEMGKRGGRGVGGRASKKACARPRSRPGGRRRGRRAARRAGGGPAGAAAAAGAARAPAPHRARARPHAIEHRTPRGGGGARGAAAARATAAARACAGVPGAGAPITPGPPQGGARDAIASSSPASGRPGKPCPPAARRRRPRSRMGRSAPDRGRLYSRILTHRHGCRLAGESGREE
jgi:hypothetical protein